MLRSLQTGPQRSRYAALMLLRILPLLLSTVVAAGAADFHLTPTGAGKMDGTSWENAFAQQALATAVDTKLQPGDRLLVGSGTYAEAALTITTSGTAGAPKTILGVDHGAGLPVFAAQWSIDAPTKGRAAIRLEPGVSHVHFRQLRIQGYVMGILAPPVKEGAVRAHLVFDDVDMEQLRHGFYLSDCDDTQLTGCDLKRYSKHGFRFDQGCDRVTVQNCTADCSEGDAAWEAKTESLPFGFLVNDSGAPNTALRFENCLARNNMMPNQRGRYKNGDGFVVERNAEDVTFTGCRALRNQDGGFDLKVADVRLTDCVAVDNKRGFRIWSTGTLTNCVAMGGQAGLWCNGGPVTATRCTFHAAASAAVMTDDDATQPITLEKCIISLLPGDTQAVATLGKVVLNSTLKTGPSSDTEDPAYHQPDLKWDGLGDAMNSRRYSQEYGYLNPPAKGR